MICLSASVLKLFSCLVQHYTELPDIKRVIVNTHAIEPQVWILSAEMAQVVMFFPSNCVVLFRA